MLKRSRGLLSSQRALRYRLGERERAERPFRLVNQGLLSLSHEDPLTGIAEQVGRPASALPAIEPAARPVTIGVGYATIEPPRDDAMTDFIRALGGAL